MGPAVRAPPHRGAGSPGRCDWGRARDAPPALLAAQRALSVCVPGSGRESGAAWHPLSPRPPPVSRALVTPRHGKPLPSCVLASLFPKEGTATCLGPARPSPGTAAFPGLAWKEPGTQGRGQFRNSVSFLCTSRETCHQPPEEKGLRASEWPSLAAGVPQPRSSLPSPWSRGGQPPLTIPRSPQHSRGPPRPPREPEPTETNTPSPPR